MTGRPAGHGPKPRPVGEPTPRVGALGWPAVLSSLSVYNDPAELERADDLVVRWPIAGKNHAD